MVQPPKTKFLQTVERHALSNLGIDKNLLNETSRINRQNSVVFFVFCSSALSSGIYLCNNATTFFEYTYSVAVCASVLNTLVVFLIIFWKLREFFQCLENMEEVVNESKCLAFNCWNYFGNHHKVYFNFTVRIERFINAKALQKDKSANRKIHENPDFCPYENFISVLYAIEIYH